MMMVIICNLSPVAVKTPEWCVVPSGAVEWSALRCTCCMWSGRSTEGGLDRRCVVEDIAVDCCNQQKRALSSQGGELKRKQHDFHIVDAVLCWFEQGDWLGS